MIHTLKDPDNHDRESVAPQAARIEEIESQGRRPDQIDAERHNLQAELSNLQAECNSL